MNVVDNKPLNEIEDNTLINVDTARKATRQLRLAVDTLLENNIDAPEKRQQLADLLSRGAWTHDYPLHHEVLREMGLPVSTEMPENVYELLSLYPQPMRQQSNVDYIPTPHQKKDQGTNHT